MKRIITVTLTALLLVLIQASPAYDIIRIKLGAKPDILLIFLSFIAFRYGSLEGVIYGFVIGLFQDFVSSATFGTHAIVFLNIGFLVGFFNNRIFSRQMPASIFIVIVASAAKTILLFLVTALYSDLASVAILIRAELLVGMPLTVIIASPTFLLFSKIARLAYDKQGIKVDDSTSSRYEE